jgi:hypothetical protein
VVLFLGAIFCICLVSRADEKRADTKVSDQELEVQKNAKNGRMILRKPTELTVRFVEDEDKDIEMAEMIKTYVLQVHSDGAISGISTTRIMSDYFSHSPGTSPIGSILTVKGFLQLEEHKDNGMLCWEETLDDEAVWHVLGTIKQDKKGCWTVRARWNAVDFDSTGELWCSWDDPSAHQPPVCPVDDAVDTEMKVLIDKHPPPEEAAVGSAVVDKSLNKEYPRESPGRPGVRLSDYAKAHLERLGKVRAARRSRYFEGKLYEGARPCSPLPEAEVTASRPFRKLPDKIDGVQKLLITKQPDRSQKASFLSSAPRE